MWQGRPAGSAARREHGGVRRRRAVRDEGGGAAERRMRVRVQLTCISPTLLTSQPPKSQLNTAASLNMYCVAGAAGRLSGAA